MERVAVVGAGIAGLAAAYRLKTAGLNPVVFEKGSFPGGRMSSEQVDGFLFEKAAYTFPEFHKNLTAFLGEVGLAGSLLKTPATSSTFRDGQEYPVKIGSPKDFLTYKLLSLRNKKDMIKLFMYAQTLGRALNLASPTEKTFELEKESAAQYLLRDYDKEILEYVAYPIFSEIFLGTPETNSKAAFLATIKNLMRFKIFAFDKGMGLLPEHLAGLLDVRLNTPVLNIVPKADNGPYEIHTAGNQPLAEEFDAVISTVPVPLLPKLVQGLPNDLSQHFAQVQYAPSIVTTFAMDRTFDNTSMINCVDRKSFSAVGTLVFDQHKGGTRAPQDKSVATVVLSESASRALFQESDDRIVEEVIKEVDGIIPNFGDSILFSRVYRWEHGAVQLAPGSLARQHAMRKAIDECPGNIYFAGDGLNKSSLEIAFNSGVSAANQLLERNASSR
jgi:protoporphyrinogen/coproporphyrinogen III oxidase